jgi:hypothetical protein
MKLGVWGTLSFKRSQSFARSSLLPKKKKLSELFLYGQTLAPVSLDIEGSYKFVVFQLYPFASKYLLGIDPKQLNDDCYDLLQMNHIDVEAYRIKLINSDQSSSRFFSLTSLLITDLIYAKFTILSDTLIGEQLLFKD